MVSAWPLNSTVSSSPSTVLNLAVPPPLLRHPTSPAGDDVVSQNRDELLLHLRLEQAVDRAHRQLCEGGIGLGKDGERAGPLQRVDQPRGLHGGRSCKFHSRSATMPCAFGIPRRSRATR